MEPLPDRWIAPYFREPTLWPVTLVVLAHAVVGVAVLLLDGLRSGAGPGRVALGVVGALCALGVGRDLRRRRLGLTSRTLAAVWVLGALAAWGAARAGLY